MLLLLELSSLHLYSERYTICRLSVGADLRDNGGAKEYDHKLESKEVNSGDITFVMGSAFEDLRLKPSREYLKNRAQERELRTKKRKR